MTVGEQVTLAATLLGDEPEALIGFVLVGVKADGKAIVSTACNTAAIIGTLAEVIAELSAALARGVDVQAEGYAAAREVPRPVTHWDFTEGRRPE